MPLKRGRPGHQLEAQPVVDHGETPRGQGEAAAISARNAVTTGCALERQASLGDKLFGKRTDLALAQPVEQPAREDHAAALPFGQTLLDQVLHAPLHRLAHLGAETGLRQRRRTAGHRLAVEPGGAAGGDLGADIEIGANSQRNPARALRILVRPQLDDGVGRAVAGGAEMRQPDMMGAAIDTVDHRIGAALQLVVMAALDQPAKDGAVGLLAGEAVVRDPALYPLPRQRPMDALDDVAALAEVPQHHLGFRPD